MLSWMLALGVAAGPASSADSRPYSALSTTDLDALAPVLRTRVATLRMVIPPPPGQLSDPERIVFGVVVDPRTVATVAQLCKGATEIEVIGPKGRLKAKMPLIDMERRVALIRTGKPLIDIGLVVSPPLAVKDRQENAEVFALVSTSPGAGVMHGVITQVGLQPEYEGHPRTTIDLAAGMPVFDAYTRWVGYARTVAWDRDRRMLIPPDKVTLARTSTAPSAPAVEKPKRPWWAR